MVGLGMALVIVAVATVFDLRTRRVPDAFAVALVAWAFLIVVAHLDHISWNVRVIGMLAGFAVTAPLFALGGLGGADVKLITALGAVAGHPAVWSILFWMAVAGGLLSGVAVLRKQRDLAYLPAITLGLLLHIFWQIRGGNGAA